MGLTKNALHDPPGRKRIAIIGIKGLPSKGGGERVAEAIIEAALKEGYKVTVYGKKEYCQSPYIRENLDIVLIRSLKGKHLGGFSFGILSALHCLLWGRYHLIHLHYADFGYIVPLLRLRYKVVGTSHGAEYHRDKWNCLAKLFFRLSEQLFVRFCNIVTCVSKPLADYYRNTYGKSIIFIPNGVCPLYPALEPSERLTYPGLDLAKNEYLVFAAGRIIPSKGCELLMQANRKLALKIPLVIVGDMDGDSSYSHYLESLANNNVVFTEFIARKEALFSLISNCRFFIFPSIYEAMSMMLLEVASLKKPIICSDIAENMHAIGENALFFRSGDSESLAEKIEYALSHPEHLDEIALRAYSWIIRKRSWQVITPAYIFLYKNAFSDRAPYARRSLS